MHLKSRGRLSAKEVCTICFFAKHAQCVGPVKDMAFRVDTASTGHYNRHLKQALRLDEMMEGSYVLDVPGHDKYELERTVHRIEAMVPHEVLAAELEEDTGALRETLEEGIRQGDWPQSFVDHEVRQESLRHGEFVWPAALYIDGFPFARRDGALAFYVYNLVSERRHLICTLRRSMLCVCGCLGWCSVYVVLEYIRWSFACLASGRWPNNRHDGKMFGTGDELRAHRASKRLVRMALVYIKADWAEFVHTIGLCSWTSILHPCFACFASQDELAESDNFSPMSPHCPAKTLAHYEQACDFCEKIVTVPDMATKARIIGLLFYDKRRTGRRGRTLRADVPDLGLLGGDRLEPSSFLMDVSSFEELSPPFRVLFWRQDNEALCKHRCPLFRVPGVSLQSLAPDTLHTLHLGVFKGFCATVLWAVILADALGTGAGNADVRLHLATARLRHDLFAWYAAVKAARPLEHIYELQNLTPSMLGSAQHQTISSKAAETGTLLEFCHVLCLQHGDALGEQGPALQEVGSSLVAMRDLMRYSPRKLSVAAAQRLFDLAKRAFTLRLQTSIPMVPKWHLMLHLAADSYWRGNPQFYSTFADEGANGMLSKICAACHRSTWFRSVLVNWRLASSYVRGATRSRRRRAA